MARKRDSEIAQKPEAVPPDERYAIPLADVEAPEYPQGAASVEQVRDYVLKSAAVVVKAARLEGQYPAALAGLKLIAEVRGVPMGHKDVQEHELVSKAAASEDKDAIIDRITEKIREFSGGDDLGTSRGNRRTDKPLLEH
jgi:hypothetical protein